MLIIEGFSFIVRIRGQKERGYFLKESFFAFVSCAKIVNSFSGGILF
ncbi:hypothetical protein BACPLE_00701 [Phocaeicola plebeius DSM 17135]|uniref:Uncharacterized protein n=1 Tax=Phocaeicola plebeius (strain DSM 17135 / JCM 12973 / CCUG 54634 / M2) TaxID=484018 RepID=B5CVG7_PHOPM|nr:hypothetical protein BACPLE_00701 [Phocaeicola plebeius DSM 17135]